jgi:hypothetical protein
MHKAFLYGEHKMAKKFKYLFNEVETHHPQQQNIDN